MKVPGPSLPLTATGDTALGMPGLTPKQPSGQSGEGAHGVGKRCLCSGVRHPASLAMLAARQQYRGWQGQLGVLLLALLTLDLGQVWGWAVA